MGGLKKINAGLGLVPIARLKNSVIEPRLKYILPHVNSFLLNTKKYVPR